MPEPLKNLFNRPFFEHFAEILHLYMKDLDRELFLENIFNESWESLELKQRARHTSTVLNRFLSGNFENDVDLLLRVTDHIQKNESLNPGIESMFIPDYIEVYGIDHPNISLDAMELVTSFFSCEFAVRPFIIKYPEKVLSRMLYWSLDARPQVRRLSSEGCRPRLPWAMAIPFLKIDPGPVLPILENLKNDPAETVRKSVANNLNDISKDNPDIVIKLTKKWIGKSKNTDWILKHGCRTLLKQGQQEVLDIFGFGSSSLLTLNKFSVLTPTVLSGKSLAFECKISNESDKKLLVRLEYGIYFLKANGQLSKKVFKISERFYGPGEKASISRKHSFMPISTRKYYAGEHKVSLIINGKEFEQVRFHLSTD